MATVVLALSAAVAVFGSVVPLPVQVAAVAFVFVATIITIFIPITLLVNNCDISHE